MKNREKKNGAALFESHYSKKFGLQWEELKRALVSDEKKYQKIELNLLSDYFIDAASFQAASELELCSGDLVLDMCAAPGGKSLVLASNLKERSTLQCNEFSASRFNHLKKVIDTICDNSIKEKITISNYDGSRFGRFRENYFDKILVDAPCSSEAHVLKNEYYLNDWKLSRIKSCATKQFCLLSSAFDALKAGGKILYSTCALLEEENDAVIEKLLKKRENVIVSDYSKRNGVHLDGKLGCYTKYGVQILPHIDLGCGPIYYCLISKGI